MAQERVEYRLAIRRLSLRTGEVLDLASLSLQE